MESFNFNELPEVIRQLFEKVELIEKTVLALKPIENSENDLLNVEEAAAFLKISTASLYTRVSRKEIPYCKPGKRLYFKKSELEQWISDSSNRTSFDIQVESLNFRRKSTIRNAARVKGY